ncbi:MAG TPA: SAM-dependent methyltransferase [Acidimicrobiales bacterium]|nr:SAM-dependent methyltransferase [Acidimicrobiales bacterium]
MRKSSVYLPDALKGALAAAASATGRSEAELIRDAVEREVRRCRPAPPEAAGRARRPLPSAPCLVGVGVGPGDPALVTVAAREVLRAADRVLTASADPAAVGRAEAVVRAVDPDLDVERVVLDIGGDRRARRSALDAAAARVVHCLDDGELVAFAVLGDPHLWSPWPGLRRAVATLRPAAAATAVVPGIMAWQDLAARTGTVVAEDDERVVLVAVGDDPAVVCDPAGDARTTVVGYRGGAGLPAVAAALGERAADAVVGELLGQPGERAVPLARAASRPASYLATTIVPARRPG